MDVPNELEDEVTILAEPERDQKGSSGIFDSKFKGGLHRLYALTSEPNSHQRNPEVHIHR